MPSSPKSSLSQSVVFIDQQTQNRRQEVVNGGALRFYPLGVNLMMLKLQHFVFFLQRYWGNKKQGYILC